MAESYSTCYKKYVRRGFVKYNVSGINIGSFLTLYREADRLRAEEDTTLKKAAELTARASRLRK